MARPRHDDGFDIHVDGEQLEPMTAATTMDAHETATAADDEDFGPGLRLDADAEHGQRQGGHGDGDGSRRQSSLSAMSSRRASRRTEALIHAAARDIVDHVGSSRRRHGEASSSTMSSSSGDVQGVESSDGDGGKDKSNKPPADDSSSHHDEHDDDVFSDDSPRSSLGSMSEAEQTKIEQTLSQQSITHRVRSPPTSDGDDGLVAMLRRPAFRSPSSVQALQMASPPASTLGTPRSARRTPLPTVSRLASPSMTAQYSPKKTPPRFKRATPPLVLLHVTLLPLRWAWGPVLDAAEPARLPPEARCLREAWRQLRDRTGDTVSDRGILLPHPQADYEVLEERLLEALELPLRRRARILECGHYLGPANQMTLEADDDAFDDGADTAADDDGLGARDRAHWCRTCHSDIKYDALGQARVFRVKVYASNGLMRAGAWEACWKEMERVDVELEPIVDAALHDELALVAAEQESAAAAREQPVDVSETEYEEDDDDADEGRLLHDEAEDLEPSYLDHEEHPVLEPEPFSSPPRPDEAPPNSSPGPMAHHEPEHPDSQCPSAPPQPRRRDSPDGVASSMARNTTPSPPSRRHDAQPDSYKTASFPELVVQAAKVLLEDKKNVLIALLSALILLLAVGNARPAATQPAMRHHDSHAAHVRAVQEPVSVPPTTAKTAPAPGGAPQSALDPCASSLDVVADRRPAGPDASDAATSTLRVFETWRVVETVTETARETLTHTETVSVDLAAAALETDALARWRSP